MDAFDRLKSLLGRLVGDRTSASIESEVPPFVMSACSTITHRLRERDIPYALIGGLALGAHKVIRATEDADFLIDGKREQDVNAIMVELGFETLRRTKNVSNYLLSHQRVDFIHAQREYSQAMLARAATKAVGQLRICVASVEDIIALKLQARHNDPSRIRDTADIHQLVEYNVDELDFDYLRTFFRMFECEAELNELLEDASKL